MFFKIMLNVFYSSIIIENEELIPNDGTPTIICANHSNSVMDAVVLVTSVSRKVMTPQLPNPLPFLFNCFQRVNWEKRKFLRSTAKDTIVNGKGITSWLIRQSPALLQERN